MQGQVICLEANFSIVKLYKLVIDGCIKVAPDEDEEKNMVIRNLR